MRRFKISIKKMIERCMTGFTEAIRGKGLDEVEWNTFLSHLPGHCRWCRRDACKQSADPAEDNAISRITSSH